MKAQHLIILMLALNTKAEAENTKYFCEGSTTRAIVDGPHIEETDSKNYAFNGTQTMLFSDKVNCDITQKLINCTSKKFNRTLEINKLSGYSIDTYEIFKFDKPHVKIQFIGICELY